MSRHGKESQLLGKSGFFPLRGKPSVLIADDDAALNQVLTSELTEKGYSVRTAADGQAAIALIDREDLDLVVLDIMMPSLNGFGVLRHIKEKAPHVKVIMLTAYGDLANAMEAKRLGADDFIGKPYQVEELLESFERLLAP